MKEKDQILLYQSEDGETQIEVTVRDETVWLTQQQMAKLFFNTKQNISLHISNIYKEEELDVRATVKESLTVQKEGNRVIQRKLELYSLDVIISVGYRVKSRRGTDFRIWANKVLKDFLLQGYALNEKQLHRHERNLNALKNTIQIMGRLMDNHRLTNDESAGLISLLNDYSYALDVLDKYDHQQIPEEHTSRKIVYTPTYEDAIQVVALLKNRYPSNALFGNEKDMSFRSSLASINQTFDGRDLYPSIEVKAAHLLYFIVKNHSFSDGNKRIAAFLLVWYMDRNNILYKKDGNRRISDNSLVALTLMIAESDPAEKDVFIQVVVSLINGHN